MDMGGHSHSVSGFQPGNAELARTFWYIIAAVMGVFAACRVVHLYVSQKRFVALPSSGLTE